MLYFAALAASWALQKFLPLPVFPVSLWLREMGGAPIVLGLVFDFSAMIALYRARTTILPNRAASHLVTAWPFSVSRNPIYFGNTLALAGLALLLAWPWLVLITAITAILVSKLAIEREEKHLQAIFGTAWSDYRATTPRWIWRL